MDCQGLLWIIMVYKGFLWIIVGQRGLSWITIDSNRLWIISGYCIVDYHRLIWVSMDQDQNGTT